MINEKSFGEPVNLSAINTDEDDITPHFHTSSQTLYFSSEGHQNMGGFDIYKSKKTTQWEAIEHLGVPINSSFL